MKKSMLGLTLTVLAAAVLFFGSTASAGTIYGDTVTCAITGSGTFSCNQPSATAGPGPEFTFGNPGNDFFSVDFGPNDVLLTVLQDNTLGGTILNITDTTNPLTVASLISVTGFTGFSASNISLSGGLLLVDLIGTASTAGATIDIGLAAPEPSTIWLVGAASMLLMISLRLRKKA